MIRSAVFVFAVSAAACGGESGGSSRPGNTVAPEAETFVSTIVEIGDRVVVGDVSDDYYTDAVLYIDDATIVDADGSTTSRDRLEPGMVIESRVTGCDEVFPVECTVVHIVIYP